MTISLFTFVDQYGRVLHTAAHLLDKGAEFAAQQGLDADEILDWRLVDDMHPLRFQLGVVCTFTRSWLARAADLPLPEALGDTLDVDGFRQAIAEARDAIGRLRPEQFAGRDEVPLKVSLAGGQMEPTLPVEQWLAGFATMNVYFHLSMAYAILRARGVAIGKIDLFPGGL
ncbi:MAG: DUF1993 domain-containing protein [Pseudomonadales bacterium]|nr:DUF1993 domain-containing protein [Pseudomonadales bacterium]